MDVTWQNMIPRDLIISMWQTNILRIFHDVVWNTFLKKLLLTYVGSPACLLAY